MNPITILQLALLGFIGFIPVWAGGQAMRCYDEGHVLKSVACVWVAVLMNISFVVLGMAFVRYNLSFVTILSALHR